MRPNPPILLLFLLTPAPAKPPGDPAALARSLASDIRPLLEDHCSNCHGDGANKGGLDLDRFPTIAAMQEHRPTWLKIRDYLHHRLMPPPDKDQPSDADRARLLEWIDAAVFPLDPDHPDPGHVVLRRLNRTEYQNTLQDLLGIELDLLDQLPPDDSGYGFDNIGSVLTVSPAHLHRYLECARIALDAAVRTGPMPFPTATHQRIFGERPAGADDQAHARAILERFARRAFRRPPQPAEIDRYLALATATQSGGAEFEDAVRLALEAMLVSPAFLFREEPPAPDTPAGTDIHPVSEHALASRLSYFLWSTMPDDHLLDLADQGQLRRHLDRELDRMLDSPRAAAFVSHFAGQWLQLRDLDAVQPSRRVFRDFDPRLLASMRRETELLVAHILRHNLPLATLLDADFTFADERLARHYGLPGVRGTEFQQVPLADSRRRGLLGHGSFLVVTSHPTRTSAVLRGKFVLENLLDTPPPPPPPNVPQLESPENHRENLTLRQQLERHREDPRCSACHALMDPIGFGLENFDATGRWRDQDRGQPLDTSGQLATGERFTGPEELRRILAGPQLPQFHRSVATKLLTYALGRGTEWFDKPAIDRIVSQSATDQARARTMIRAVVHSTPFQSRRKQP